MPISSARDALTLSNYNTLAAEDASFGTTATAIANAQAATPPATSITLTSPTQALLNYLMSRGYEVRQTSATTYQVDWSTPTDAAF